MPREETKAQLKRRKVRYAIRLRKRMTVSEKILWEALRNRQFDDLKFRRQAPVSWFVVDFLCMKHNLIIEIDGPIHDQHKVYDQEREDELKLLGYRILRFTNEDILYKLETTLESIKAITAPLSR
jgi:phosphoribosylformylglycinamidine synthase subunit PurQ / glutaminase